MKHVSLIATAVTFGALSTIVLAQSGGHASHNHGSTTSSEVKLTDATTELAEGEVRKIDKEAKKITLKHGEIKSLDMTPMTMVFQVRDAKLLEGLKVGDKVKFSAERAKSGYFVSTIQVSK